MKTSTSRDGGLLTDRRCGTLSLGKTLKTSTSISSTARNRKIDDLLDSPLLEQGIGQLWWLWWFVVVVVVVER